MGFWLVDADVLARSRFVVSPLLETVTACGGLATGDVAAPERAWLLEHQPAFRARLHGDPFARSLLEEVFGHGWTPDFMAPPPRRTDPTFADEVRRVRATAPEVARADLLVASGDARLPSGVDVEDPAAAVADLLAWVWERTIRPGWARRRRLLQADVVGRTATLSHRGIGAAIEGLGPQVRWLGSGRLQINTTDRPPRDLAGADLVLVPTTGLRTWVGWDLPHRYAIVYPAAGLLAPTGTRPAADATSRLLGPTRARLLALVEQPTSTSQLVAITDLALGTVGHHLKVLLDSGLVERRRSAATVLYYRSRLGDALVHHPTQKSVEPGDD